MYLQVENNGGSMIVPRETLGISTRLFACILFTLVLNILLSNTFGVRIKLCQ